MECNASFITNKIQDIIDHILRFSCTSAELHNSAYIQCFVIWGLKQACIMGNNKFDGQE